MYIFCLITKKNVEKAIQYNFVINGKSVSYNNKYSVLRN